MVIELMIEGSLGLLKLQEKKCNNKKYYTDTKLDIEEFKSKKYSRFKSLNSSLSSSRCE